MDDRTGEASEQILLNGSLLLGRQDIAQGEPEPFRITSAGGADKLIITSYDQRDVSRKCLEILCDPNAGGVRIRNIGNHEVDVISHSGGHIAHEQVRGFSVDEIESQPLELMVANNVSVYLMVGKASSPRQGSTTPTMSISSPPSSLSQSVSDVEKLLKQQKTKHVYPTPRTGSRSAEFENVLTAVSQILEKPADTSEFFLCAAENVCRLGGFDECSYLGLNEAVNRWECQATWPDPPPGETSGPTFNGQALAEVWTTKTTWRGEGTSSGVSDPTSRQLVVSPILIDDKIIGALYAWKKYDPIHGDSVNNADVKLVEVIRDCLTAGFDRLGRERESAQQQVCLDQFFPPAIAHQIAKNPSLLETREANVSVLFCDILGFDAISSQIGSRQTFAWMREVLSELSESIARHDGVLLEYVGDGIVAMWGAPVDQPQHADMACRAATDMVNKLAKLNQAWSDRIPDEMLPFGLTIGINTGNCFVGNKGTDYKYMWGPLGPTVNLASKVHRAAKRFQPNAASNGAAPSYDGRTYHTPMILLTQETRERLSFDMRTRYLGLVQFANDYQPTKVHELATGSMPDWDNLREGYEEAYRAFEQQNFAETIRISTAICEVPQFAYDGPTECLRVRAHSILNNPQQIGAEHPAWRIDRR